MKKRLQGLIAGVLIGVIVTGSAVLAASTTNLYDVIASGIKIVIDGKEIIPTDVNGNIVEPFIYNGTTYLPVRAVGNALGKAVYWDGPNYTVYLGDMNGRLEYPTLELRNAESVDGTMYNSDVLTDNYGTRYKYANYTGYDDYAELLLNMKYSKFKATLYVSEGTESLANNSYISIIADGKTIYTSDALSYESRPIDIDVDITGCNQFVIKYDTAWKDNGDILLGNAGFYQ